MKVEEITFAKMLLNNKITSPDKIAICSKNQTYTYKELNEITDCYAAYLVSLGIKKGDHVAIWGYNSANWFIIFFSILKVGAVAVLVNYSLSNKDVIDLMTLSDVKFIFYGNNKALFYDPDSILKITKQINIPPQNTIRIERTDCNLKKMVSTEFNLKKIKHLAHFDDPHRTAVIIFTTGTTSLPKAVMLSQYSIINDANGCISNFISQQGNALYNALPLFHSYGLSMAIAYMHATLPVYLNEEITPKEIANDIKNYKPSDVAAVGAIYSALIDFEKFEEDVMPYIRTCLLGGSVSTPTFICDLENKFKNSTFITGYGLTETSPVISSCTPDADVKKRSKSVGKIIPNIEVRIWNKTEGFLPIGKVGEIVVKGYVLMNGYYKLPLEQQPFDKDGWLHTGDLGYLDETNYLFLAGRIKDIINKKGENISPLEIEKKIMENPSVKEVKVIGMPHPTMGESIEACIVLKKEHSFSLEEMVDELKMKLSHFKIPNNFWIFEKFPLTGNGKLDLRKLKEQLTLKIIK